MKRATLGCNSGSINRLASCAIAIAVVLAWSLGSVATVEAGIGFTFNDGQGNSGYGTLGTIDPGLGDGSSWATTGTLVVTSGVDIGTYSLSTSATTAPFDSADGAWIADNLIYPANNAGNGVYNGTNGFAPISNPALIDTFGLLFSGTLGGSTIYLNIYANGGGDYAFGSSVNGVVNVNTLTGASFALVPEPTSLAMLGVGIACVAGYGRRRRTPAAG